MLDREDFWQRIEPAVRQEGIELFDLELPGRSGGVLRIYIWRARENGGVSLDDCARVSRRIEAVQGFDELIPDNVTLEVSSPGINRRLSRAEHFRGALGERVRLVVAAAAPAAPGKRTVLGTLSACSGEELEIVDEKSGQTLRVPRAEVSDARVDFQFK